MFFVGSLKRISIRQRPRERSFPNAAGPDDRDEFTHGLDYKTYFDTPAVPLPVYHC
jgi:hypothetical protein